MTLGIIKASISQRIWVKLYPEVCSLDRYAILIPIFCHLTIADCIEICYPYLLLKFTWDLLLVFHYRVIWESRVQKVLTYSLELTVRIVNHFQNFEQS